MSVAADMSGLSGSCYICGGIPNPHQQTYLEPRAWAHEQCYQRTSTADRAEALSAIPCCEAKHQVAAFGGHLFQFDAHIPPNELWRAQGRTLQRFVVTRAGVLVEVAAPERRDTPVECPPPPLSEAVEETEQEPQCD